MIAAAVPLALVLLVVLYRLKRLRELHHGWYGVVLLCLPWWPAWALGGVLYADDLYQHTRQLLDVRAGRTPRPDFTLIHGVGSWAVQAWRDASHFVRECVIVAGVVLCMAAFGFCHAPAVHDSGAVKEPPAVVKADVAAAHADTVYRVVTRTVVRRVVAYDSARAQVPAFSTADSVGRVPVDTVFVQQADSVRQAVTDLEAAARQRHAADSAQVAALRRFTVDLQTDLAHSEPKCRVLGVGCPSRKSAFVAGGAVALVLVVAVAVR